MDSTDCTSAVPVEIHDATPLPAPLMPDTQTPVEEILTGEETPADAEATPTVPEETPVPADETPVSSEEAPVSSDEAPVSSEEASVSTEETPAIAEKTPAVTEETPVAMEETPAAAEETLAAAEETLAAAKETPATAEETLGTAEEPSPTAEETSPAAEETSDATKEMLTACEETLMELDNDEKDGSEALAVDDSLTVLSNMKPREILPPQQTPDDGVSTPLALAEETPPASSAKPTPLAPPGVGPPKVSLRMNEFGIYELMPEESTEEQSKSTGRTIQDSISISPVEPNGDRWKAPNIEIVCCKQCHGYGIADEFVEKNYCSDKCRKNSTTRSSLTKSLNNVAKIQAVKRKSTSQIIETSADSAPSSPAHTRNSEVAKESAKSFSWSKYLERRRAQAAPERLFSDPFPYGKHGFRPGMKLEGIDPEHQSLFCVLTVVEVQGYRIRLHFDGYSDSHDYWINADSENIFPSGWCEKNGQKLQAPRNHDSTQRPFNWAVYLKQSGVGSAPRHIFCSTQNEYAVPSAFRVKMKLEAVDRRHSSHTLCVASVANVIGNRFLVHFDGWDDIYDYWADPSCPYVHPVGWSNEHNMALTPPCDFDASDGDFSWERYLSTTGSMAVPPRAFKPRSPVGFKTGMKLECVDPRNPRLIRVATVATVKGYRLKIHFDGWSTDFDFWTDDDWPDLHPAGWCAKTGHPLQPPPSSCESAVAGECPSPGCNGIGHIEGAKYASHRSVEHCPYYSRNLHRDKPAFPDRLAGLFAFNVGNSQEAIIPANQNQEENRSPRDENHRKAKNCDAGSKAKSMSSQLDEGVVDLEVSMASPAASPPPSAAAAPPPPAPLTALKSTDLEANLKSKTAFTESKTRTGSHDAKSKASLPVEAEVKAESPPLVILNETGDSSPGHTPPYKKIKVSYFTSKVPVSRVGAAQMTRKTSSSTEDLRLSAAKEPTNAVDVKTEPGLDGGKLKTEPAATGETKSNGVASVRPNSPDLVVSSRQQPDPHRQMLFVPAMNDDCWATNTNLTTPLCWSKHASLLSKYIDTETVASVSRWTVQQVVDFLVKFGTAAKELDHFREEEIDGEALLCLSQNDLVEILHMKLGPAIKIQNALLLLKEKMQKGFTTES